MYLCINVLEIYDNICKEFLILELKSLMFYGLDIKEEI